MGVGTATDAADWPSRHALLQGGKFEVGDGESVADEDVVSLRRGGIQARVLPVRLPRQALAALVDQAVVVQRTFVFVHNVEQGLGESTVDLVSVLGCGLVRLARGDQYAPIGAFRDVA